MQIATVLVLTEFFGVAIASATGIALILWVIFFLNLTVLNLLNSWLPTLVDTTGLPHDQALRIASSFQFGGMIGVISMGVLADRAGFTMSLFSPNCGERFARGDDSVTWMPVLSACR